MTTENEWIVKGHTSIEDIEKLLKDTLKQDRAKTQVEGFTKLNLMELKYVLVNHLLYFLLDL